jgi:hypothetical protein
VDTIAGGHKLAGDKIIMARSSPKQRALTAIIE